MRSSQLILYFMAGLQPSATQFFVFLLITFSTNLGMLALFRALASSNRQEPNATTCVRPLPLRKAEAFDAASLESSSWSSLYTLGSKCPDRKRP